MLISSAISSITMFFVLSDQLVYVCYCTLHVWLLAWLCKHRIAKPLFFFILCRPYIPQEIIIMTITTRLFGRSGPPVTQVGLGGEGVLRTHGREREARAVIEQADAQGIT